MPSSKYPPHLQLVNPPAPVAHVPAGTQLFLPLQPARFYVVDMNAATKHSFVAFLREERPVMLFDARPVPSFALDSFSRKTAFRLFEQCSINYFDLAATVGVHTHLDSSLSSGRIAERITEALSHLRVEPDKIGILLENVQVQVWTDRRLYEAIRPHPAAGWQVELVPQPRLSVAR